MIIIDLALGKYLIRDVYSTTQYDLIGMNITGSDKRIVTDQLSQERK